MWFLGGEWEWDEYSRNLVVAVKIERILTCPDCGTRRDEWDEKQGGEKDAYYAEAWRCMGCAQTEAKSDQISKDAKEGLGKAEGIKIRLIPKAEHLEKMAKERERQLARRRRER